MQEFSGDISFKLQIVQLVLACREGGGVKYALNHSRAVQGLLSSRQSLPRYLCRFAWIPQSVSCDLQLLISIEYRVNLRLPLETIRVNVSAMKVWEVETEVQSAEQEMDLYFMWSSIIAFQIKAWLHRPCFREKRCTWVMGWKRQHGSTSHCPAV